MKKVAHSKSTSRKKLAGKDKEVNARPLRPANVADASWNLFSHKFECQHCWDSGLATKAPLSVAAMCPTGLKLLDAALLASYRETATAQEEAARNVVLN